MGKSIYRPPVLQPAESGTIRWLNNIIRLLTDHLIYGSTAYIWCGRDFQPQGRLGRQDAQFNRKSIHLWLVAKAVSLKKLPSGYTQERRVTTVLSGLQVTIELNRAEVTKDK